MIEEDELLIKDKIKELNEFKTELRHQRVQAMENRGNRSTDEVNDMIDNLDKQVNGEDGKQEEEVKKKAAILSRDEMKNF